MKQVMVLVNLTLLFLGQPSFAQRNCVSDQYRQVQLSADPALANRLHTIEENIRSDQNITINHQRTTATPVITIPVVVHVLYHYPQENISDDLIRAQITALNRDFRMRNPDTSKIPAVFVPLAADCQIEFKLAISDPQRRSTTGIIRKYTPVKSWTNDDKIKSDAEMGSDAWDTKSYLNIWVGSLDHFEGYSSFPGSDAAKDGIVLHYPLVGTYLARTAVHEAGHWLGLFHLWGTESCGDDLVYDTPKQRSFTPGCPSGIRVSCGSDSRGDMYMNYMDYTSDACVFLFTEGQKQRMHAAFATNGPRYSILGSKGLSIPLIQGSDLPVSPPRWLDVKLFPNPVQDELTVNWEYDVRWIGKTITLLNSGGQTISNKTITGAIQKIDVSGLKPGLYFIRAEKNGEKILHRFIKQ